jgi:hypothetical protein
MKQVFTSENAEEAEKYIGKKVICFYQEPVMEGGPFRLGILEEVNKSRTPFAVDINMHKIISNFGTIAYDPDMDDTLRNINDFIHMNHCEHKIDVRELNFNYCPVCGEKL